MEPLGRRQALLPIRYSHGELARRRTFVLTEHTFAELDHLAQLHQHQVEAALELSSLELSAVQDRADTRADTESATREVHEAAGRLFAWLLRHPERGRPPGWRWVRHLTTRMRNRILTVQDELNGFGGSPGRETGEAGKTKGADNPADLPSWDEVLERLATRWGVTPVHIYETMTPRQAARLLPHVERGWWRELTGLRAAQHAPKWEEPKWTHLQTGAGGPEDEVRRKIEEQKRLQAEARKRGKLKWDPRGE